MNSVFEVVLIDAVDETYYSIMVLPTLEEVGIYLEGVGDNPARLGEPFNLMHDQDEVTAVVRERVFETMGLGKQVMARTWEATGGKWRVRQ